MTVVSSQRANRVPPSRSPSQRPLRPPTRPTGLALAATLHVLTRTSTALATTTHTAPTIEWRAPAGCPDEPRVHEHIARVVGPALADADTLTRVQASVVPQADAWLLVVLFTAHDGTTTERRLTLRDCEATANATALLIAIAITGTAPAASAPRELPPALAIESPYHPPPEPTPPAPPAPPAPTQPILTPPTAPIRPRLLLTAGPALAVGILPRATPGLQVALGGAWPRLRLTLAYLRLFRSPARLDARPNVGTDLSLHLATARVGPVRRAGPLELHANLGLELGALRAEGVGSDLTFDRRTWWAATLLGGAIAWAPRALRARGALLLHADLVLPLHRPTFTLAGDSPTSATPIFRPGPLGLRLALLLEARLF